MKNRIENLEKKIVASDRNQPRIYLTKQEAQRFDVTRPVFISIEQEDYPVVDAEVIELFNQKLNTWFQQQSIVQPNMQINALEPFIFEMMTHYQFLEVARNQMNIGFARNGKYLNIRYPSNSTQLNYPLFGFDDQIQWLKNEFFKHNFVIINDIDFDGIMNELYSGGLINAGLITNKDGEIFHISKNWSVEPEDVKKCINYWHTHWKFVTLQNVKYSVLYSQPSYLTAVNYKEKKYLVCAASPEENGECYYILGQTPADVDGKLAYIEVAKAANRMKDEIPSKTSLEILEKPVPIIKTEYDVMVALERQLGSAIPLVSKLEYNSFGFIANGNHVVALGLFDKNLTSLPESFWSLKSLKILSLSRNKFTSLPESIGNLTKLETLWLQENKLSSLPNHIGSLTSLQTFTLWNNKLSSLPDTLGNLSALQELNLFSNQLTSLPLTIGNLSQLKELYLHSNKLTILPDSIGNLKSLQILDLRYNSLAILPESLGQLTALKVLHLMNNALKSIPESIGNLTMLQILNISDNWISSLPESIKKLTELKELYTNANQLPSEIPEEKKEIALNFTSKLEEKIVQAWENLPKSIWDDKKSLEIIELTKSGGDLILSSRKVCDIKYRLVQSNIEYKKITEWREMDELKYPDRAMKKLIELNDRLQEKRAVVHPSLLVYFKESLKLKSKEFQEKISGKFYDLIE